MAANESTADNVLIYEGATWEVETEPTVVESEGDSLLLEVWVKRGEDSGKPE